MIIAMRADATPEEIGAVMQPVGAEGLNPMHLPGGERFLASMTWKFWCPKPQKTRHHRC